MQICSLKYERCYIIYHSLNIYPDLISKIKYTVLDYKEIIKLINVVNSLKGNYNNKDYVLRLLSLCLFKQSNII